eukprot:90763_1
MSTHQNTHKPPTKRSNSMTHKKLKWLKQSNTGTKTNQKLKRSHSSARVQSKKPFHHKPFKKPGPRDIGRIENSDWTPIKYNENVTKNKNSKKPIKKSKIYKPGPREIGRIKKSPQWKPIELTKDEEMKLNVGNFLEERITKNKNTNKYKEKIYKPGPRDIGRNNNWNPIPIPIKSKRIRIKLNSKSDKNNKCKKILIPNLKIVYSPRINEAIFIGYKNINNDNDIHNGDSDSGHSNIDNDNDTEIIEPKPQTAKFTFLDMDKLESKWSENENKNDLCNDKNANKSELNDESDIDNNDSDSGHSNIDNDNDTEIIEPKPQTAKFTFLDMDKLESKWSENENKNDLCNDKNANKSELNDESDIDNNDSDSGHSNIENDNGKRIEINDWLSDLLNCDDDVCDSKKQNYMIIIDEIEKNDNGDDVYSGCLISDENNDQDNQELLFDFQSFVDNLKKKTNDTQSF